MKFHILIYGCQFNYADSARIKAVLENIWFEYTSDITKADIVIFDTCSVRQKSEDKIWWKLAEIPRDKKIWITGCMVGRNLDRKKSEEILMNSEEIYIWQTKFKKGNFLKIKEVNNENFIINEAFWDLWRKLKAKFDNVELLFRIDDLHLLPVILYNLNDTYKNFIRKEKVNQYLGAIKSKPSYLSLLPAPTANQIFSEKSKTAYVPIQIGCNQFCSYCIVPYARGLEKNRPFDEILSEVKYHLSRWKQEIVLLGQIVNKHPDFYRILKEILSLPGLKRLRYTSPYPTRYTDEILALHENEEKLVPHIHAPVQSGSDVVLKRMFRWYSVDDYKRFVEKVKNLKRDISITTDIIVWFPGETEEDFQKTLELTEFARFDMIYIGIYSPRPGTYAAKHYKDDISQQEKKRRWKVLNDLLQKISYENNLKEIWKQKDIMVTKVYDDGTILWYDEKLKNVIVNAKSQAIWKSITDNLIWDFVKVEINQAQPLKLFWKLI